MCSSSQGDQPFNITWHRNNVLILSNTPIANSNTAVIKYLSPTSKQGEEFLPPDPSLTINQYTPFSSILSIHNVSSSHNGNYTCRVANHAGTVEYTAPLSVSGKSRVTIALQRRLISTKFKRTLHQNTTLTVKIVCRKCTSKKGYLIRFSACAWPSQSVGFN